MSCVSVFSRRAAALGLALAAVALARPAGAQKLKDNHFTVDLFQGPILAPISIMGVAGAYSPVAEGISGFVSNAASPAVRESSSFTYFDWDLSASISIPLPLFENDDFDDSGSRDQNFSNFFYVEAGGLLQIGQFGFGLNSELQRYTLTHDNGPSTAVNVGKFKALAAARIFGDQLVLGGGARVLALQFNAPGANLTQAGFAPEVGVLVRPDWQSFRIGATFRAPVDAGAFFGQGTRGADGVLRAGGLVLPDHVEEPWELQFGVAVQVGPRPLNPKWLDPHEQEQALEAKIAERAAERARKRVAEISALTDKAEAADRARELDTEEVIARAHDVADLATGKRRLEDERRARTENWPREHLLFIADVLLTGPVARGVSVQSFLGQNEATTAQYDPSILLGPAYARTLVGSSGATLSFSPRLGVETEPVPGYVHTRVGSYYEPARYTDRNIGRQHFTFGADLRTFTTKWFGFTPHGTTYKIQASGDFSARYQSISLGLGTWH